MSNINSDEKTNGNEEKQPSKPSSPERRNFLKQMTVIGGILGVTPFIPFGSFFNASLGSVTPVRQKIVKANGQFAKVDNIEINSAEIFPFPRTGDEKLDAEPFRRYQLIRLASEHGGDATDVSAFRVYSMICVHLWCLWEYKADREVEVLGEKLTGNIECPCHGSNYNVLTGKSWTGPAALQTAPNDSLPNLPIEIDSDGYIWVLPPDISMKVNGVVGVGRYT